MRSPSPRKRTKSRPSQNTRRLSGFTPISKAKRGVRPSARAKIKTIKPGFWAEVVGVSMWPTLRETQKVWVERVFPEALTLGDVVVLKGYDHRGRDQVHVHRIIGRVGPYFVEAGDNSFSCGLVRSEDILGRVALVADERGRKFDLPPAPSLKRFRLYREMATAFLLVHELKDRVIGPRKSPILWTLSKGYRALWRWMGIDVPLLYPKNRFGSVAKDLAAVKKFHNRRNL
jgi:hypothetical protein